jgi:hypothetical protein
VRCVGVRPDRPAHLLAQPRWSSARWRDPDGLAKFVGV